MVRPGETLFSIAAQYGADPAWLSGSGQVPADGALAVGQTLVLRFPRLIHAVRRGETLFSIAAAYGVTVRSLWRRNWSLNGGDRLCPGQPLVIPYWDQPIGSAVVQSYAYYFGLHISRNADGQLRPSASAFQYFFVSWLP